MNKNEKGFVFLEMLAAIGLAMLVMATLVTTIIWQRSFMLRYPVI